MSASLKNPQQQTISYNQQAAQSSLVAPSGSGVKQVSQSLVAQHRNRNLIGSSSNRPFAAPSDSLSVGLNSNFSKNLKGRDKSHQPPAHQMDSIVHNPLNDLDDDKEISRTAKKADGPELQSDVHLLTEDNRLREQSNSQRSFRIRKGYVRSISRGSNSSKMSNLTHDHAKKMAKRLDDKNQNTIEHPTDVEDAAADFDGTTEFEHINASPDIKLKSIEVDDDF